MKHVVGSLFYFRKLQTKHYRLLCSLLFIFFFHTQAFAVTCTSTATGGNWNATGTWTGCTGGNGTPANTPGTADTAVIATTGLSAVTVNVAVTPGAVIVNSGARLTQSSSLVTSTASLSGNFTTAGTVTSTQTLTVNGALSITAGTMTTSTATTTVQGNFTMTGGTFTPAITTTINGALSITSATFTANTLNANGTTTLNTGGTLNLASNTTRTFVGLVTIDGGTWAGTSRNATFRGGLTYNSGTFTPGTGTHTFNTTLAQSIGGLLAVSIPRITVTGAGVVLTNTGTLTIATALAGTGALAQAANTTLNIGASITITTLNATATGNTVNYTGAATQTLKTTTYHHIGLTGAGAKRPGAGTFTVNGNFSLASTWSGNISNPALVLNPTTSAVTFNNAGTFTSGTGLVTFQGSMPILLSGNNTTFSGSLTINNSDTTSGVTLRPTITVTGTITLSAGRLLTIGDSTVGTTPFPTAGTRSLNATSIVKYAGTTQTVLATTYGNLNLQSATGSTTKTLATGASVTNTLTIGANTTLALTGLPNAMPTTGSNSFDPTSTINYSGVGAQTVAAISYANLSLSGTGVKTLSTVSSITVSGNLDLAASTTLALGGTTTPMPTVSGTKTFNATSTVDYNGSGAQTISAETYGNLSLSTSGTKSSGGNFSVAGTFTITLATYSGGTTNPTLFGSLNRVSGTFTQGTGTLTFIGPTAQTITNVTDFSGNVTIGNGSTSTSVSIPATAVTTISGTLTVTANATLNLSGATTAFPTTTSPSLTAGTVNYSGSGIQTVAAQTYGNLIFSNAGAKRPTGTFTIQGDLTVSGTATYDGTISNPSVTLNGNLTGTNGTFNVGTSATAFTFGGSSAQTITTQRAFTGTGTVIIANTDTVSGVSLSNAGSSTFAGNLTVNSGSILTLLAGTTTAFPTVTGTETLTGSTIRYAGAAQNITSTTTIGVNYHNLVLTAGNTKTMGTAAAQTINIDGSLTIETGVTYTATANNPTINLKGNFACTSCTAFSSGTGVYTLNGTSEQTFTTTLNPTTFSNLTINKSSGTADDKKLTLNNDITVATALSFTSGYIVTGTNKVILSTTATTIGGAGLGTLGWVAGNLQKAIAAAAASATFQVGTHGTSSPALAYSPVTFAFTGISAGNFIVGANLGEHPSASTSGLDTTQSVNRWWNLSGTNTFTNYSATFTFVSGDVDVGASTSNFHVVRYKSSTWTSATTVNRLATSTQATGVTAALPSEFAIGQPASLLVTTSTTIYSDPYNNLSFPKAIPGAIQEIINLFTNPSLATTTNTVISTHDIDSNMSLYVDNIGGPGPVIFTNGTPSSGLTFTFTSLASLTDDVEFFNGVTWNYVPTIGGNGCDTAVTKLRINPKGVFATGQSISPQPSFQIKYRACIK